MKADVVVDLQFGSTAKGKLCQWLAERVVLEDEDYPAYDASIRVQSINAGHTVMHLGKEFKMRTIPCAWVNPYMDLLLGAGCFIELELLEQEIVMLRDGAGVDVTPRLVVDPRAWIISPEDFKAEADAGIKEKIGSTGEAAGSSLIRKMWRTQVTNVGKIREWFGDRGIRVKDTISYMSHMSWVLVEGCQGTLLGLHTSPYYPFVTSRECSAAAVIAECGISPREVADIWGVMRTYPIRVGGHSGETGAKELTWDEVAALSGNPDLVPERTTVTNRQRRIFEISWEDLEHSMRVNRPSHLALTFIDYVNHADYGKRSWEELSSRSKQFILDVEAKLGKRIRWISTGKEADAYFTL